MLTAIVLARAKSTRLPEKHFKKIGKSSLINIILERLKLNKNINKIIICTGSYKNNFKFNKLIDRKKNITVKYFGNEEDVTSRVYKVTKKIDTKYSIIISGDCPVIDNKFIDKSFEIIKKLKKDFILQSKKVNHEGTLIFKTKSWKKVFQFSDTKQFKEHPGSVLKFKKKDFNIGYFSLKKFVNSKIRLSIDTKSDLDFFNLIFHTLKEKKKMFDYQNVIKLKNFKYVNNHVVQVKVKDKIKKKINIFYKFDEKKILNQKIKIFERELSEIYSPNFSLYKLSLTKKNYKNLNILNKINKKDINIFFVKNLKSINYIENSIKFIGKYIFFLVMNLPSNINFKYGLKRNILSIRNIKRDRSYLISDYLRSKNFNIKKQISNYGCKFLINKII